MNSLAHARFIQFKMGGSIYWDKAYSCFRVMQDDSLSLQLWPDHYERV